LGEPAADFLRCGTSSEDAVRRGWYHLILIVVVSAGCQSASAPPPFPPDPLILGKKPLDKATQTPRSVLLAVVADPRPPALPTAVAIDPDGPRTPGTLTSDAKRGTLIAVPAVRSKPAPPRQEVVCGYAPDRTWLQGVLEKHYHGHFYLRYGRPDLDERWNGKVRLESDPRLAEFRDGDGVRVAGSLVPPLEVKAVEEQDDYPLYRLHEIRRLEQDAQPPPAE